MIIEIGIVSGEIWHYLDTNGEATISQIVSGISRSREMVLMSLGWLAREGHVVMDGNPSGEYKIFLRK